MSRETFCRLAVACALLCVLTTSPRAQDAQPAPAEAETALPTIADEPKTVDPAAFMPAPLAASATTEMTDSSLREALDWLRDEKGLVILLDNNALANVGILPGDPISDRLDDAPIYLLLNRLRTLELAWYFEDEILHITTVEAAEERLTTVPYNVGDLLDAGYEMEVLGKVIRSTVEPTAWDEVGGPGAVSFLGDVMFIRQTDDRQRAVRGLLAALRKHGRRTLTFDPPQHAPLREALRKSASIDFQDVPLETAVAHLATVASIDIRLDANGLEAVGIRRRQPVSLALSDRKLETVLQAMLIDFDLTWMLRDGVLWITPFETTEEFLKTAVYDVRDLCRDDAESDALHDAITSQAGAETWDEVGGPGTLLFARPGTMVVSHTESMLNEVLQLLETYRAALRESKPRQRAEDDPDEVITVYYRMHANVANGLAGLLPRLVRPDSWRNASNTDAPGEVSVVPSTPELSKAGALAKTQSEGDETALSLVVSRSVLIIRQTRAAHEEIQEVIQRVESGDGMMGGGMGGMGGGMGGFGGGFFSVPSGD